MISSHRLPSPSKWLNGVFQSVIACTFHLLGFCCRHSLSPVLHAQRTGDFHSYTVWCQVKLLAGRIHDFASWKSFYLYALRSDTVTNHFLKWLILISALQSMLPTIKHSWKLFCPTCWWLLGRFTNNSCSLRISNEAIRRIVIGLRHGIVL